MTIIDFDSYFNPEPPTPPAKAMQPRVRKQVQRELNASATLVLVEVVKTYRGMFNQKVPALAAAVGKSSRELLDMRYDRAKQHRALEDTLRFTRDLKAAAEIQLQLQVIENEIAQLDAMRGNQTALFQYRELGNVRSGMQYAA